MYAQSEIFRGHAMSRGSLAVLVVAGMPMLLMPSLADVVGPLEWNMESRKRSYSGWGGWQPKKRTPKRRIMRMEPDASLEQEMGPGMSIGGGINIPKEGATPKIGKIGKINIPKTAAPAPGGAGATGEIGKIGKINIPKIHFGGKIEDRGCSPVYNFSMMPNGDLVAILKGPDSVSEKTEVAVVTEADDYQTVSLKEGTGLGLSFGEAEEWYFGVKRNGDLVGVLKGPTTESSKTEIHIYSAVSKYKTAIMSRATGMDYTFGSGKEWDFVIKANGDLVGILKGPTTESGKTELQVLSADSDYQLFTLTTKTGLHIAPGEDWEFGMKSNDDLVCILKGPTTESNKTEVHILSALSNYQDFVFSKPTILGTAGANWAYVVKPYGDLVGINKGPVTSSGKTEIMILSASSDYQTIELETGTGLDYTSTICGAEAMRYAKVGMGVFCGEEAYKSDTDSPLQCKEWCDTNADCKAFVTYSGASDCGSMTCLAYTNHTCATAYQQDTGCQGTIVAYNKLNAIQACEQGNWCAQCICTNPDCDGDGVKDIYCKDAYGKSGVKISSNGCVLDWGYNKTCETGREQYEQGHFGGGISKSIGNIGGSISKSIGNIGRGLMVAKPSSMATTPSGHLLRIRNESTRHRKHLTGRSNESERVHGRHRTPDQSAYASHMRQLTKSALKRKAHEKKAAPRKMDSDSIAEGVHAAESGASDTRSERRLLSFRHSSNSDPPQFENPSFESGSDTDNFKIARAIPGWRKYGRAIQFIRKGAEVYGKQRASSGNYLIAFLSKQAGLWQAVDGHTIGTYYRLVFNTGHRKGYSCPTDDPCTMDIFVMDRPKKWTDTPTTTVDTEEGITWYEIAYIASAEKMYFAFVYGGPYDYGRAVFLDDVGIRLVEPWTIGSSNPFVLLQTVSCTDKANPTEDTCSISDYVTAGEFDGDGVTTAPFTGVGSNKAVWAATEHCTLASDGTQWCSGKYKFKSYNLKSPSAITNSTGSNWFLDSGYTECATKNAFAEQTAMFMVNTNNMGYYTLSDQGVKCGFMFLIQEWKQTEMSFAR